MIGDEESSVEVKSVSGGGTEGGGVVSGVVSWMYWCELISLTIFSG